MKSETLFRYENDDLFSKLNMFLNIRWIGFSLPKLLKILNIYLIY